MLREQGLVLLDGDRNVPERAAGRLGDLLDRFREGQQARTGQLVDPTGVPFLRQRRDGHVGDVVGVDERLDRVARREGDFSAQHLIAEEPFAEVLVEPGRAEDGPLGPGLSHRFLAEQGSLFAPPR